MISGRNPELLIGQHVLAAPYLKASGLEVIPTGYLLIDGGTVTTAQYVSNTMPIPGGKGDIAACTAMAGEMLGLRLIYLDAGSGAARPVAPAMIRQVKESISVPLIVGGGIREPEQARHACQAGADVVVVGNALENDPSGYLEMARAIHQSE
jgi:putative glycerol-1-phosphate prenyltransferase